MYLDVDVRAQALSERRCLEPSAEFGRLVHLSHGHVATMESGQIANGANRGCIDTLRAVSLPMCLRASSSCVILPVLRRDSIANSRSSVADDPSLLVGKHVDL